MSGRIRLSLVGAVSAALLVMWQPLTRGQQPRPRVADAVRAAAIQNGSVRIIVGVRVDGYQPEGYFVPAEAARQRTTMLNVSSRVLDRLPASVSARARRFDFIPYFAAVADPNTLLQLEADPDVVSIEEDRMFSPTLAQSVPLIGGSAAWAAGYSGAGWAVAILDTGFETSHSFLTGKFVAEGCYSNAGAAGPDSLCPGGAGSSTAPGSATNCVGLSGCEHGTHVAGIAAGKGASFSGVARDASILGFKVFTRNGTSVGAYSSDLIAALNRVYALRGTFNIAAVNMSLGGSGYTSQASCDGANPSTKAAIDLLRSVNIATVIASGNDGYVNAVSAPGCISTAVSVGSTTKSDVVSDFTNSASFLNLLAPGSSINSSVPGNTFSIFDGTSMAAPHVAGAWAVLKQRVPFATVAEILNGLRSTGLPITDSGNGLVFPRIRVNNALNGITIPYLRVDGPSAGSTVGVPFNISGWAIDRGAATGTGIDVIHIYAYPAGGGPGILLGAATYGGARPDIGSLFGGQFTNSGYSLNVSGLANGSYQITAYGHSTVTGAFTVTQSVSVTVSGPVSNPAMALDAPSNNSTSGQTVTIAGWAIDRGAPSGTGVDTVHVWAFPSAGGAATFLGAATYGLSRPDIGGAFGNQFTNSGFRLAVVVPAGNYTINAYMHSTVANAFNAAVGAVNVTVNTTDSNAVLFVDTPAQNAIIGRSFPISGWAVDSGAPTGTGIDAIHVWAFPTNGAPSFFAGVATYGSSRPDIGALFGDSRFTNSGYTLFVTTANVPTPGTYDFYVFGHSTVTGGFPVARIVRVTVQ